MLAEERSGACNLRWGRREMDRAAERLRRAGLWMLDIDNHSPRERLRMRQRFADRMHGPHRNARSIERGDPFVARSR